MIFFRFWLFVWLLVGWELGFFVIGLRRRLNVLILELNKFDKLDLILFGLGGRILDNLAGEWRMCMREGVDLNFFDWIEVWDFIDRLLYIFDVEEGLVFDVKGIIGSINELFMFCVWIFLLFWVFFLFVLFLWILFFVGECRDNIFCGVDRKSLDYRDIEFRLDIRLDIWELIFFFFGEFFING